jgi:hypothetical protein
MERVAVYDDCGMSWPKLRLPGMIETDGATARARLTKPAPWSIGR